MVLPKIEGQDYSQENPPKLYSNTNFHFPPVLSENADTDWFRTVWNKLHNTELKIKTRCLSRERKHGWSMSTIRSTTERQRTLEQPAPELWDTFPHLPPNSLKYADIDKFGEVKNKLKRTVTQVQDSSRFLREKLSIPNLGFVSDKLMCYGKGNEKLNYCRLITHVKFTPSLIIRSAKCNSWNSSDIKITIVIFHTRLLFYQSHSTRQNGNLDLSKSNVMHSCHYFFLQIYIVSLSSL